MLSIIFLHFNDLLSRDSIIPRDAASDSTRSLVNIVWGCFGTLFACTWIAIHTNIPAPKEKATSVLARRLAVMLYMLIVPELVIMWAARQFMAARQIARRNSVRGWTKTHAFFAIMGGFQLYVDRKLVRTLQVEELETLESEGKISWPHITVEEIKDKSKADYFSKAVVVLQVLWFVTQCVARGVERIVLTQLEVSTLAFSAITMFTYILWWNKPMDIGVAEKVHLKEGFSLKDTYSEEEWQRIHSSTPSHDPEEHQLLPLDIREGSILNVEGGEANAGPLTTTEGSALPFLEVHLLSLRPSTSAAGTNETASFTDLEVPPRQTEPEDTVVLLPSISDSNPALPPSEDLPLEITIGAVPTEAAQVPLPPDESQLSSEPVIMGDPSPMNTTLLPSAVEVDIGILINPIISDGAHALFLESDSARSKEGDTDPNQLPSGNDIPVRSDEQDSPDSRITITPIPGGDGGSTRSTSGIEQALRSRSLPDGASLSQSSTSIPKLENRGSSANSDTFFKKLKHTPLTYVRYKLGDEIHSFTLTMEEIMLAFPNVLPIIPKKLVGEVASLRKVFADLGCTMGVVYCFIELPIKFILFLFQLAFIYPGAALVTFALGFGAMVNNTTLVSKAMILDRHKGFVHEPPLRVPTFYSPKTEGKESYFPLIIASVVALIFGSIHCIAWNFDFPTSKESQYWRIASVLVSSGPIALIIIGIILQFFLDENSRNSLEFFAYFLMLMTGYFIIFMYTLARICLLVLPLIGLRNLPPAAFIDIDWTVFVPHVHI